MQPGVLILDVGVADARQQSWSELALEEQLGMTPGAIDTISCIVRVAGSSLASVSAPTLVDTVVDVVSTTGPAADTVTLSSSVPMLSCTRSSAEGCSG